MIDIEPTTHAHMVLAFLQGELVSPRTGGFYKAFLNAHGIAAAELIDHPDLSNIHANKVCPAY